MQQQGIHLRRPTDPGFAAVCAVASAIILVLGWAKFSAPFATIVNYFTPDDVFYYFQTARNFAHTGFSSFDSIHYTNGYQPLWFLICAFVFLFFPDGGQPPVYILLVVQLLFYLAGTLILLHALRRMFGLAAAAIAIMVWVMTSFHTSTNGLESGLLAFLCAVTFNYYGAAFLARGARPRAAQYARLGVLAGVLFLARTDMNFTIIALTVALALRRPFDRLWLARMAAFAIPLAVIAGAYLWMNYYSTGHLMPVSGAAKIWHSDVARNAQIKAGAVRWRVIMDNYIWVARDTGFHYILFGLAGPWILVAISLMWPGNRRLRQVRGFWPFYVGALVSYLFYCTMFHGAFTKTQWYYILHTMLTALFVAACSTLVPKAHRNHGLAAMLAMLPVCWLLNWGLGRALVPVAICAAVIAGLLLATRARHILVRLIGAGLILAVFAMVGTLRNPSGWTATVFLGFMLAMALAGIFWRRLPRWVVPAVILPIMMLATSRTTYDYIRAISRSQPRNWNYNLYLGALWARDNLPKDATIWSGSTGILGYFSERRCVNTDGLINSYYFFEKYLKGGKLYEYLRKWDYSIDAYPDELLAKHFRGGYFIKLPPELQKYPFADGNLIRVLHVFKMPERK